ncbi:MAG: hypothetical protein IIA35_06595 [Proteobacteria bacterium]|nr:hypothetical protein [Pseudomonadota bacterium]
MRRFFGKASGFGVFRPAAGVQRRHHLFAHVGQRPDAETFHVDPGAHGQQPAHLAFDVVVVFGEFDLEAAETGAEGQALFERQADPLAVLGRQRLGLFGRRRGGHEDGDGRRCPEARHNAAKIRNHGPNGRRKSPATQAGREPAAGLARCPGPVRRDESGY